MPFPNVDTQFKSGESGNLAGKPKGTQHVSTWINNLLHDDEFTALVRDGYQFKEFKGAPIKAIVGAQIRMAISGDSKATDLLFKYGYGTKTEVQHSGEINTGTVDPALAQEFADFLQNKTKQST